MRTTQVMLNLAVLSISSLLTTSLILRSKLRAIKCLERGKISPLSLRSDYDLITESKNTDNKLWQMIQSSFAKIENAENKYLSYAYKTSIIAIPTFVGAKAFVFFTFALYQLSTIGGIIFSIASALMLTGLLAPYCNFFNDDQKKEFSKIPYELIEPIQDIANKKPLVLTILALSSIGGNEFTNYFIKPETAELSLRIFAANTVVDGIVRRNNPLKYQNKKLPISEQPTAASINAAFLSGAILKTTLMIRDDNKYAGLLLYVYNTLMNYLMLDDSFNPPKKPLNEEALNEELQKKDVAMKLMENEIIHRDNQIKKLRQEVLQKNQKIEQMQFQESITKALNKLIEDVKQCIEAKLVHTNNHEESDNPAESNHEVELEGANANLTIN
jgi:hypothetical protein